jgi:Uma2 family endonuclease
MLAPILDTDLDLPTSEELPCSDDTPVDNEGQNTIPNGLLAILKEIWAEDQTWFFGVDMGIYDRDAQRKRSPKVIPDGFLSLGVQRHKREGLGRLSYVLQEENEIVPILVLEYVSKTYGGEYDKKFQVYAELGVLYYVIYNPEYSKRDQHKPFEVYKLIEGSYVLQPREPVWMPEIRLGIGRVQGELDGIVQEWLAWHNVAGEPYPLPQEMIRRLKQQLMRQQQQARQELEEAQQETQQARQELEEAQQETQQARQEVQQERLEKLKILQAQQELLEKLRQKGIDVENL